MQRTAQTQQSVDEQPHVVQPPGIELPAARHSPPLPGPAPPHHRARAVVRDLQVAVARPRPVEGCCSARRKVVGHGVRPAGWPSLSQKSVRSLAVERPASLSAPAPRQRHLA